MFHRTRSVSSPHVFLGSLVLLTACVPPGAETPESVETWDLVRDQRMELVDATCAGADCPRYPNPFECGELHMALSNAGRLCGACARSTGSSNICGGFLDGLPFQCRSTDEGPGRRCARCEDVFGELVFDGCFDAPEPARIAAGPGGEAYLDVERYLVYRFEPKAR